MKTIQAKLKTTKKREDILRILQEAGKPLSAEEIYEKRTVEMNISTVYRALHLLVDHGVLEKTVYQDGKAYFGIPRQKHSHHLICTRCHAQVDIDICPLKGLEQDLQKATGFTITGHSLEFSGICPACAGGEKTEEKE